MGKCPVSSQKAQTNLLSLRVLSHTDSLHRIGAGKGNAELTLVATPIQEDLKELRNTNCPPRDKSAFSIFDLSNPNLKKKKINEG